MPHGYVHHDSKFCGGHNHNNNNDDDHNHDLVLLYDNHHQLSRHDIDIGIMLQWMSVFPELPERLRQQPEQ